MIKIDKDIPLPSDKWMKKYPFEDMEVGDSFLVRDQPRQHMSEHASRIGKKLGRRFMVRTVPEGVRVWRKA